MGRKKLRKKLRGAKRFAVKIFGRKIVREALGFILILGILYFGVSGVLVLALRTDTYWMAVISPSMKHDGVDWREYFENKMVRQYLFLEAGLFDLAGSTENFDTSRFPLQGGFERGDMLVIQGVGSVTEIAVGDVIIFDIGQPTPLVHRVVGIRNENGEVRLTTKGDGNSGILSVETSIKPEQIMGKVIFVIPKLGYLSLWFQGS